MFTGIIETQGIVDSVKKNGKNLELTILSSISDNLRVDQSVSHDGVCLTITSKNSTSHQVTLVNETIKKHIKHSKQLKNWPGGPIGRPRAAGSSSR